MSKKLIPHDGRSEAFVCRDCMTLIDPVGHHYPDWADEQADNGECPLCGSTDTNWVFASDEAVHE